MLRKPEILFYTKPHCPLCTKAKRDLNRLARKVPHQLTEIDITQHDSLFSKYRHLIPLGELATSKNQANEVLFTYRVEIKKVEAFLKNQGQK